VFAGLLLAGAAITFLQSLTHTTVANTLFILGAIPFFTAALAWVFLKEQPRRATLVTMVVAFLGITVMMGEGFGIGSVYGNAMALLTALCFSIYAVLVRHNRQVDMLPAILISTFLIMVVVALVRYDALQISRGDLLLCMLWGGVMSGFTSACFIVASRHIAAAELTIFMLLEFALGPIWVWLFINEVPSRWTLIGGALVISAVLARSWMEFRSRYSSRPVG
jgi:drug/metabolite transporter (DMT)-like permease